MNNTVTGKILLTASNQTQKTFQQVQKDLQRINQQAAASYKALGATTDDARRKFEQLASTAEKTTSALAYSPALLTFRRNIEQSGSLVEKFTSQLTKLGAGALLARGLGAGGLARGLGLSLGVNQVNNLLGSVDELNNKYRDQMVLIEQTRRSLKGFGVDSRVNMEQMTKFADERSQHWMATKDDIIAATGTLAAAMPANTKQMQDFLQLSNDLAEFEKTDLRTATEQVADAYVSQRGALGLLREANIAVSQEDEERIQILEEYGDRQRALAIVLDLVRAKVTGQSDAMEIARGEQFKYDKSLERVRDRLVDLGGTLDEATQKKLEFARKSIVEPATQAIPAAAPFLNFVQGIPEGISNLLSWGNSLVNKTVGFDKSIQNYIGNLFGAGEGAATADVDKAIQDYITNLFDVSKGGTVQDKLLQEIIKNNPLTPLIEQLFGKQSSLEEQNQNFKESNRLLADFNDNMEKINDRLRKEAAFFPKGKDGQSSSKLTGISGGGIWGPSMFGGGGAPGGYQEPPASMLPPTGGQPINVGGAGVYTPPPTPGPDISAGRTVRAKGSLARNQQEAYSAFRSMGYDEQSAKIAVANFSGESLRNPADIHWDVKHYSQGIASWEDVRAARIKRQFGKLPREMSIPEQAKAFDWEASHYYKRAYSDLRNSKLTEGQRMHSLVKNFENPADPGGQTAVRLGLLHGMNIKEPPARNPVTESVQPGLAKQRDPMELLQQPRQDVQLGRGKVDLNLKLDRNINMVRPAIQPAENFDLGVSVDRTGQFFARPGDPAYAGSGTI